MSGRLVVVGDPLLDVDLVGVSRRLCPDAPAPVVEGIDERARPGGAALAAALAAGDGHEVVLVAPLGADDGAKRLRALLEPAVQVVALPWSGTTGVKTRVRVDGKSLLRLDTGDDPGAIGELPPGLDALLRDADAVLLSDYGRGVTRHEPLRALLAGLASQVPLVWDPHPRGGEPVPGARVVTPNTAEAESFTRLRHAAPAAHAVALARRWHATSVAVTMGPDGALLADADGVVRHVAAPPTPGQDSCGAGDRFASAVAVALGGGRTTVDAVAEAVTSAAAFVAAGGAAAFDVRELPERGSRSRQLRSVRTLDDLLADVRGKGGTVVATGGCFDLLHAGHVSMLRAARQLGDCLVVCLNSDASVRRLKGPSRPLTPERDRARVLAALECVDAVVIFDEDTPEAVLARLRADVWAKGGDYGSADLPEARLVEAWGGRVELLPYLSGRSTTRIVRRAVNGAPGRHFGTRIDLTAEVEAPFPAHG